MSEVARKVLKDTRDSIRVELERSGRQWAKTDLESAIDSEIERRYGKAQFNANTVDNDYGAMGWKWSGSAVISKLLR